MVLLICVTFTSYWYVDLKTSQILFKNLKMFTGFIKHFIVVL